MAYGTNKLRQSINNRKRNIKSSEERKKEYEAKIKRHKKELEISRSAKSYKPASTPNKGGTKPAPKKADGGTYMAFPNGRIGRTNGKYGPYESMDTTGYAKGKKSYELMESYSGYKPSKKTISRSEVPSTINRLKKGATRVISKSKSK